MTWNVLWVRQTYPWMGHHSGYDQLCRTVETMHPARYGSVWREENKTLPMGLGHFAWKMFRGIQRHTSPTYDIQGAYAELRSLLYCFLKSPDLVHLLYVERLLGVMPEWKKRLGFKLIGTAHQPAGWWRMMHPEPEILRGVDALIVPSRDQAAYFDSIIPGRVFFIPHGVDLEFFVPPENPDANSQNQVRKRCLIVGHWLRDIQVLVTVIERLIQKDPLTCFDIIVPGSERSKPEFYRLARHTQIHWHSDVSDEELRDLYQNASLLLLPLIDSTANNTILEAIASGLPIIATDVGGVKDYAQDSFAELYPIGDAEGMVNGVMRLLNDRDEQIRRGKMARKYVEENLGWKAIASQTIEVYERILADK